VNRFIFLIFIVSLIEPALAGGDLSNGHHHGSDNDGGKHWAVPYDASNRANPISTEAVSIERGRKLFLQKCASCHGATARGDGPAGKSLNPKPADLKKMSGTHPDGDFAWKIENGRGVMPAWKNILNQNQIWDLVNYIQSLSDSEKKNNPEHIDDHVH